MLGSKGCIEAQGKGIVLVRMTKIKCHLLTREDAMPREAHCGIVYHLERVCNTRGEGVGAGNKTYKQGDSIYESIMSEKQIEDDADLHPNIHKRLIG